MDAGLSGLPTANAPGLVLVADLLLPSVVAGTTEVLVARGDRETEVLRELSCEPVLVLRTLAGAGVGTVVVRVQKVGCASCEPRTPVAGRLLIGVRKALLVALEWVLVLVAKVTPLVAELAELFVEWLVVPELRDCPLLPVDVRGAPLAAAVLKGWLAGCGEDARAAKGLLTIDRRRLSVPLTRAWRVRTACSTLLSTGAGSRAALGCPAVLVVSWLSRLPRWSLLPPHVSLLSVLRLLDSRFTLLRLAIFSNFVESASDDEGCTLGGTIFLLEGTGITSAFCRPELTVGVGGAWSACDALRCVVGCGAEAFTGAEAVLFWLLEGSILLKVTGAEAISSEEVDIASESIVLDRSTCTLNSAALPRLDPSVALFDPGLEGSSDRPSSSLRVSFSW